MKAAITKDKQKASTRRLLPGLAVREGFMRHPFDLENGVRTSGLIAGRDLSSGHRHDRYSTAYYGVAPSVFHWLLRRWQRTSPAAAMQQTHFVDVGGGMGRALLLAAEMPFCDVIGVELNPTLVRIAQKNLAAWRKAGRAQAALRIHCADAVDFALPDGPCVAFLFNPFGAPVMRQFLSTLAKQFAQRQGELDLLYVNNEQEGVLEKAAGFTRLYLGKVKRSSADAAADKEILANQPDGEYASASYEDCSIWRWTGKKPRG